jgi:hypothetical protein
LISVVVSRTGGDFCCAAGINCALPPLCVILFVVAHPNNRAIKSHEKFLWVESGGYCLALVLSGIYSVGRWRRGRIRLGAVNQGGGFRWHRWFRLGGLAACQADCPGQLDPHHQHLGGSILAGIDSTSQR